MAINLHDKYAKQIQTEFKKESLTNGRFNEKYSFEGVKTVKISTPVTVPMNDYTRSGSNRYGTPVEMQDYVQELTMTQDKSFSLTIDKGNNADQQGIKAAGKMLALQLRERAVPLMDTYVFAKLAQKAGTIVGNGTALSKTNIADRVTKGTAVLDNAEVPESGRTLYVTPETYNLIKLSPEFLGLEKLGTAAIAKGQVGEYDNMAVIKVPTSRWPANVNFIIAHKDSACAPVKLNDTKLHQDPPGISGNLLEGRQYYDCFVYGPKSAGIYTEVDGAANVLAVPAINASTGAITAASGATVVYTLDGTDPRYSNSAKEGTTTGATDGQVISAYQYKTGVYSSAVAKATKTA